MDNIVVIITFVFTITAIPFFNVLYAMYSFSVLFSEIMKNRTLLMNILLKLDDDDHGYHPDFENYTESDNSSLISKELIINTTVKVNNSNNFCIVCQQDIKNEITRELSCCHSYHIKCIDMWLSENDCCPTCRTTISPV